MSSIARGYLIARSCTIPCQHILVLLRGVRCTGPAAGPARRLPHCTGKQRRQAARGCQTAAEGSAQPQREERPNIARKWRTGRAEIELLLHHVNHIISLSVCVCIQEENSCHPHKPYKHAAAAGHHLVTGSKGVLCPSFQLQLPCTQERGEVVLCLPLSHLPPPHEHSPQSILHIHWHMLCIPTGKEGRSEPCTTAHTHGHSHPAMKMCAFF